MKICNKLNLPKPFVSAVTREYEYKEKQYSVTTILKDIREILLTRRHHNEIEQDVADMIWLIFGTAVHKVLEDSEEENVELKEEHFSEEVFNGYKLSGQADLYNAKEKMVIDYKTCSAWKVVFDDWEDYRKQLLMYAWAFKKMGFEVEKGQIVAVIKDHSKTKAKVDKDYPKYPVYKKTFEFKDKDFEEIEKFIIDKFKEIEKYENIPDEELPICSEESRWNTGDKFAVKKKGNKRALKVYDTLEEANEHIEKDENLELEIRKGEDKKCLEYCSCCEFCDYWKQNYENKEEQYE
ncbi:MAG: PD-(D/E)XK nuclease family protein [Clostridiales bacterium]|nr:PD-(D/E)XK nuclease family protein [Clostridiales bacterium]